MRITRALSLVSVMLVAAGPVASGCGLADSTEDKKRDIFIAADLELSGAAADLGTAYNRALKLKIDQLNESGTLDGRRIRYEVRDNQSNTTMSLANITDFTNDPSVDAIITGSCSECIRKASGPINDKKVPAISLSPASSVTNPITPYIFKLGPNAMDDASALLVELSRAKPKVREVAVLTTDDEYGRDGMAAMEDRLGEDSGFIISAKGQFKPTDTNVTATVRDVLDSDPDALVVWSFAGQAQQVATTARKLGFKGPLLFDAAAAGDLFQMRSATRGASEITLVFPQTMVIDDVIATTPAEAARKQWFRDYTAAHGSYYGPTSFAADAVQLLVDAIDEGGANPEKVRSVLESTQMDGLSGPLRITPANHSALMPQALVALTSTSGRWRLKV